MLPPIQVEYLRSGGAKIFILMSLTASFWTSVKSRSPKPLVRVLPPERTMLEYRSLRKSRSVRLMESTTIWCTPGYSRPMISGSKRISGARKRSAPIYRYRVRLVGCLVRFTQGNEAHLELTFILFPSGSTYSWILPWSILAAAHSFSSFLGS